MRRDGRTAQDSLLPQIEAGKAHLAAARAAVGALEGELPRVERWGRELACRLLAGCRVLAAGNGGSAAQAQHFVAELVGRFESDKKPLPAMAISSDTVTLTAVANDYGYDQIFAKQVSAHGRPGDLLLCLSTSGRSANLHAAGPRGTPHRGSPPVPRGRAGDTRAMNGTFVVVGDLLLDRDTPPGTRRGRRVSMDEVTARGLIQAHFDASNVSAAGGAPGDDIAGASEIYADDAVVEWPQGGERLRGKANIIAFRSTYPTRQQFELHRTTGCHDLWVNEYTIRYDDHPVMVVGIMEFRDDKVVRERIYFGDRWEPPAWRAQWVERFDPGEPDSTV